MPKAFDFQLVGDEAVDGRPACHSSDAALRLPTQGKYSDLFSKVQGKVWVDKQDLGWIKVDGEVIQPFSMGLILARGLRGSHIKMDQTPVDDGIWMPKRVEVRASAKIFFIKSLVTDRALTYSDYRLPQSGGPLAGAPLIP